MSALRAASHQGKTSNIFRPGGMFGLPTKSRPTALCRAPDMSTPFQLQQRRDLGQPGKCRMRNTTIAEPGERCEKPPFPPIHVLCITVHTVRGEITKKPRENLQQAVIIIPRAPSGWQSTTCRAYRQPQHGMHGTSPTLAGALSSYSSSFGCPGQQPPWTAASPHTSGSAEATWDPTGSMPSRS